MPLQERRAIASTKPSGLTPKKQDLVNTATLTRGRVYVYKGIHFEKNVEIVVSDEIADALTELYATSKDTDGEEFEKPLFDVRRRVTPPSSRTAEAPKRTALRLPVRPYSSRA